MQDKLDNSSITVTVGSGPNKHKEIISLPLPPGSLPPRKRAKTSQEKEQRRIERIMRNRQAAHASRERKRRHLADLEEKCKQLEEINDGLNEELIRTKKQQVEMVNQHYVMVDQIKQLSYLVQFHSAAATATVNDTTTYNNTYSMTTPEQSSDYDLSCPSTDTVPPLDFDSAHTTPLLPSQDKQGSVCDSLDGFEYLYEKDDFPLFENNPNGNGNSVNVNMNTTDSCTSNALLNPDTIKQYRVSNSSIKQEYGLGLDFDIDELNYRL